MKTTIVRATAVAIAVIGLAAAPAAAATPGSHELPGSPTPIVAAPGDSTVTPDASFCQAVPWWLWCRI